jgi:hypothetical protein
MSKYVVNCRLSGQRRRLHKGRATMDRRNPAPPRATAREKTRHEIRSNSRSLARDPSRDCRWAKPSEHPAVARRGRWRRRHGAKPWLLPNAYTAEGTGQTNFTNPACFPAHIKRKPAAAPRSALPGQPSGEHQEKTRVRVPARSSRRKQADLSQRLPKKINRRRPEPPSPFP